MRMIRAPRDTLLTRARWPRVRLPDTGAVHLPLSRRTVSLGLRLCAARAAPGDSALAPPALLARAPADATAQRGRAILALPRARTYSSRYVRSTDNPDVIEARDPHGATLSIMLV